MEKLRRLLKEKNMTSRQLASATGIHPTLLSKFLNGSRKASLTNLLKMSVALNAKVRDISEDEEKLICVEEYTDGKNTST